MLILPDGVRQERLISDEYRAQQRAMHANPEYGVASQAFAPVVAKVMNQYAVVELLDYGAGKGRLAQTLMRDRLVDHPFRVQHYEPAVHDWSGEPTPTEMVACIDVLEHIEPHLLDNVLDDLVRVTKAIGLFSVSTEPAIKKLPDGRNAHLIIEPLEWWVPKLMARFSLHVLQRTADGFFALVMSRSVETQ